MTTIAYRDGYVAADSASWKGDVLMGYVNKIHEVSEGVVFVGCGVLHEVRSMVESYESRTPFPELKDATVVQFNPNKRIMEYGSEGYAFLCDHKTYMAWGSGSQLALGAMAAGATAEEAVKAAVKHDAFTAGKVKVVKVW